MDTIKVQPTTFIGALVISAAKTLFLVYAIMSALGMAGLYVASQRYELVAAIPKGSIVFDRATGEVFQKEPLPMFRGRPE